MLFIVQLSKYAETYSCRRVSFRNCPMYNHRNVESCYLPMPKKGENKLVTNKKCKVLCSSLPVKEQGWGKNEQFNFNKRTWLIKTESSCARTAKSFTSWGSYFILLHFKVFLLNVSSSINNLQTVEKSAFSYSRNMVMNHICCGMVNQGLSITQFYRINMILQKLENSQLVYR